MMKQQGVKTKYPGVFKVSERRFGCGSGFGPGNRTKKEVDRS